jgi:hypothetical protein
MPDETGLPLADPFYMGVRWAVSYSFHCVLLEKIVRRGWPPVDRGMNSASCTICLRVYPVINSSWLEKWRTGKIGITILRGIFRMIPKRLCLGIHPLILKAVDRWDPQPNPAIKALPFGLCLKTGPRVPLNEGNALLLVEKHTTVPAPRLINVTVDSNEGGRGMGYLLMTQVPGISIERARDRLTYEERHQIAKDLAKCISQWRKIPNTSPHFLCDTLGGPFNNHRMAGIEPRGPFNSMSEFLDFLTKDVEFARTEIPSISALYKKKYEACFTHSDLHPTNIIIQQGRLSGIVDWEHASFKPEYWEYTRAIWPYPEDNLRVAEFRKAFEKDYEEELVAERKFWHSQPGY